MEFRQNIEKGGGTYRKAVRCKYGRVMDQSNDSFQYLSTETRWLCVRVT